MWPEAFLGIPVASGLWPCTRPTFKKALYHIRPFCGTADIYRYHSGQSKLGSNGNHGVLNIPQSPVTGVSSSAGLVLYPGQLLEVSYLRWCSRRIWQPEATRLMGYIYIYFLHDIFWCNLLLYNNCWHGFWVRSWWPCVLWQAITLWLVNREMAVRQGRPVEQVCNRKETTWYENHAFRFRQRVQSESSVEPGILSRSEALGRLWRYGLQGGASVSTSWL